MDAGKTGINFRNLVADDESLNGVQYIYFYDGAGSGWWSRI